jgi:hypothetical protein
VAGERTPLELHVAGATVRHASPFSVLDVPLANEGLTQEMIDTWVVPIYFGATPEEVEAFFRERGGHIRDDIVQALLTQFGWRERIAGAYLVAATRRVAFQDLIGRLLLRSDVCFAGAGYCLALAMIGTDTARDFLIRYLEYYLTRPDLHFDQHPAHAALCCMDMARGQRPGADVQEAWASFSIAQNAAPGDRHVLRFREKLLLYERIAENLAR